MKKIFINVLLIITMCLFVLCSADGLTGEDIPLMLIVVGVIIINIRILKKNKKYIGWIFEDEYK